MSGFTYYVQKIEELGPVQSRFSLKGKVALVTGAGGGIGRSTANAFADLGADVALMDIPQKKEVLEHNAQVIAQRHGVRCICVYGDVSNPESVQHFVDEVVERLGTIDVVHSNAGIGGGDMEKGCEMDVETWNRTVRINLTGVLLVDAACARVMKQHGHGGSIITTASMSGVIVNSGVAYASTKAGVTHMSNALAIEYAKDNIRFNSVCYGYILSGLHEKFGFDDVNPVYDGMAQATPLGRIAPLEEAVGVVLYLATDLSSFQTSSHVVVDGGVCMDRTPG